MNHIFYLHIIIPIDYFARIFARMRELKERNAERRFKDASEILS